MYFETAKLKAIAQQELKMTPNSKCRESEPKRPTQAP
jgi:hypothetical protein